MKVNVSVKCALLISSGNFSSLDVALALLCDKKWDTVMSQGDIDEHIEGLIMANQYFLKKGVELLGDHGKVVEIKEIKKIHDMET